MHQEIHELKPVAPFDFGQSLAFVRGFPLMRGESGIADDSLTRAVENKGETVAFRVVGRGSVEEPSLECTLYTAKPITAAVREAALDLVTFFLSLGDDLAPFYAIGRDDPVFAPVIEQLYGYHQVKFLTPFENAAWAILSQRVQMPVARKMREALIARYGTSLTVAGETYHAFPSAERLATTSPDDLLAILPTLRKAEYLRGVARAFDDVEEQWLHTAPYDEVHAWLLRIPGIGAWSASFVLIRGLGRTERTTTEEPVLRAAAQRYGPSAGTPEGLQVIADRYGEHQGYWAHYLRAAGVSR